MMIGTVVVTITRNLLSSCVGQDLGAIGRRVEEEQTTQSTMHPSRASTGTPGGELTQFCTQPLLFRCHVF